MSCNGAMLQRGHFDSLLNMMATHVLSLHMQERKCALWHFHGMLQDCGIKTALI